MKYLIILAIVFTSLCVGLPIELPFQTPLTQQPGISIIDRGSPDVYLSVQTIPLEVRADRTLTLIFEIRNKNTFDLEDIIVTAYDRCIFTGGKTSEDIGPLRPNETKTWTWEWTAGQTDLDKDCKIKFRIEYYGEHSLTQDILVLSKSEYQQRTLKGTLKDIPIRSYSTNSPLNIILTFPESQPFIEDTSGYSMYIDYYNIGNGFITVNKGDINIDTPGNIGSFECDDYFTSGEPTLKFIKNKALRTICSFRTILIDSDPISMSYLSLTARYKYILDNSISVRVNR